MTRTASTAPQVKTNKDGDKSVKVNGWLLESGLASGAYLRNEDTGEHFYMSETMVDEFTAALLAVNTRSK
jgi:hypothetical protein